MDTGKRAEEHLNRGKQLAESGDSIRAIEHLRKALELGRTDHDTHFTLARCLALGESTDEAISHLQAALKFEPRNLEALNLLGHLYLKSRDHDAARDAFLSCLEIDPNHVTALWKLAQQQEGGLNLALARFEQAHRLSPENTDLAFDYAWAMQFSLGDPDTAADLYWNWHGQTQPDALRESTFLQALNYASKTDPEKHAWAHREWGRRHADPLGADANFDRHDFSPDRPLRVGLISADFINHPVGRFTILLCNKLDPSRFEQFVYASMTEEDHFRNELSKTATWRPIHPLDDDAALEIIREDRIDVLIDLSGHTKGHRLHVLARRPAPVQATLFAYPNTTGMAAVDYRITDPFSDPPGGTEHLYTERLERLPHTAWVYLSPNFETKAPDPVPSLKGGHFTFGCLNNPCKISAACIQLWAELLQRIPKSRLVTFCLENGNKVFIEKQFATKGVQPDQIDIRPKGSVTYYFDLHREIDLMLDPFPYNGGVTTCDSLWMGVPVLTLAGHSYVSRQGVCQLTNVGLEAFIAQTPGEFLDKAVQIASRPVLLEDLRKNLRTMLVGSPMMDHDGYARGFGAMLERWWKKRCTEAESSFCSPNSHGLQA